MCVSCTLWAPYWSINDLDLTFHFRTFTPSHSLICCFRKCMMFIEFISFHVIDLVQMHGLQLNESSQLFFCWFLQFFSPSAWHSTRILSPFNCGTSSLCVHNPLIQHVQCFIMCLQHWLYGEYNESTMNIHGIYMESYLKYPIMDSIYSFKLSWF